jgi:molecular chaperone DnaK
VERAPENPAWKQLRGEEQASIMATQSRLAGVKQGDDLASIREATAALDLATRRFAELMMDSAVTTAIRGKTMDAADEDLGEEVTAPHPMARAEFK